MKVATVGGMGQEMQMGEQGSSLESSMDGKQQQNGNMQQAGFQGPGFASAIPITAQAGVIDGMEE